MIHTLHTYIKNYIAPKSWNESEVLARSTYEWYCWKWHFGFHKVNWLQLTA